MRISILKNATVACCLLLLFVCENVRAQFITLSPQAKISLVTVGPGKELYAGFGHSVLWVQDPAQGIDNAYNYGTFTGDFNSPSFYIEFLRSTLPYYVSVMPLAPMADYWRSEHRSIFEQVLNLSQNQKQRFFNFLETNRLPQNREYQYKFFYDNCATRLTVGLKQACGDSLVYQGYTAEKLSFRQWIDKYAYKQKPWADFGMDLALGTPADDIANAEQATFLPDNLSKAFATAKVKTAAGIQPLVTSTNVIYKAEPVFQKTTFTPAVVFWTLAVLTVLLTWWQIKKEQVNFAFDKVLFAVAGIAGWILLLLWFGTDHGVTRLNYDILWAFPLWMPAVFFFSEKKKPAWFQYFLIFYGFLLLCATGNVTKHNYVIIPILLMLITRVYYINNSLSKIPARDH